jgi:hypothetical protein
MEKINSKTQGANRECMAAELNNNVYALIPGLLNSAHAGS